jgi:hypothetical protein
VPSVFTTITFFFLSLNLLIGWHLPIWHCCKPFFSLQYNYFITGKCSTS